jgi:hypothetical protein
MVGIFLPWLDDEARATGWPVVTMDGWETRSNGHGGYVAPGPLGVVEHHTASPDTAYWTTQNNAEYATLWPSNANKPEYAYVIGRDGTIWVCAAGGTNGEGKGGPWNTSLGYVPLTGANNRMISVAYCYDGVGERMTLPQWRAGLSLTRRLLQRIGGGPGDAISHKEWVDPSYPGRKIDPWGPIVDGDDWGPKRPAQPNIDTFRARMWLGSTRNGLPADNVPPPPPPQTLATPGAIMPIPLYLKQSTDGKTTDSSTIFRWDGGPTKICFTSMTGFTKAQERDRTAMLLAGMSDQAVALALVPLLVHPDAFSAYGEMYGITPNGNLNPANGPLRFVDRYGAARDGDVRTNLDFDAYGAYVNPATPRSRLRPEQRIGSPTPTAA